MMSNYQELILTVGLPGSGKSTYINKNYLHSAILDNNRKLHLSQLKCLKSNEYYSLVSADLIKEQLQNYTSENPEIVHQDSVEMAEQEVYAEIIGGKNVIMDGGGINNNYTPRIINNSREINPNIHIKLIFFNTPLEVCIERIKQRSRKVPISEVYKKSQRLPSALNKLKQMVDEVITIDYFTNKYIFLDMDGTVCSFTNACSDINGNIDFVNGEIFKYLDPVQHIIDFVRQHYSPENIFILTACPNSICWNDKKEWLKKHMPFLLEQNIFFVGNKEYKHVFLEHLMLNKKFNLQDVCVVEDMHSILEQMRKIGVHAIHPSNIKIINSLFQD